MKVDASEWVVLGDQDVCSVQQLVEISGLSHDDIDELVAMGVIAPVEMQPQPQPQPQQQHFYLHSIVIVNQAARLRDDFELDRNGMVLALTLMQRIEKLEQVVIDLRAHALT
jgi:chaperone modulatory protein CbpM